MKKTQNLNPQEYEVPTITVVSALVDGVLCSSPEGSNESYDELDEIDW